MSEEKPLENLEEKSSHGGVREGSGRKKGSENEITKEKRIVTDGMKKRVMKAANKLLDAQMTLAQGIQMLYVIKTIDDKKQKPEIITDAKTIESFLAGELDNEDDEYYFITTERPDNRALDSLFDRTFGKAIQYLDIKDDRDGLIDPEARKLAELAINNYLNEKLRTEKPKADSD